MSFTLEQDTQILEPKVHRTVTIVFDGGTPCNDPNVGYGIGYGSYKLNKSQIFRVDHGKPMSANVAEILTLKCAVAHVSTKVDPSVTGLLIKGDSQIALWLALRAKYKPRKGGGNKRRSPEFNEAVRLLQDEISRFAVVTTEWHSRKNSVALFGH